MRRNVLECFRHKCKQTYYIAHYNMYQNMLKHRLSNFILMLFTYIINDIKYKYVHMYEYKLTQMVFFLKLNFVHRFCHPAKSFYIRQKAYDLILRIFMDQPCFFPKLSSQFAAGPQKFQKLTVSNSTTF